jgi:hypothetical protein
MSDVPLVAHSLAEVYLYLMVTPCGKCGRGPLKGGDAKPAEWDNTRVGVVVEVTCSICDDQARLEFDVPAERLAAIKSAPRGSAAKINPTPEPSRIIDVAGWVTLFGVIADAAARATDKGEARMLGYEAAQCLDEALKFYDQENELPPEDAFFSEASRRRHREHPQKLARSRLIDLRARLPSIDAMEKRMASAGGKKRRWWKPWG